MAEVRKKLVVGNWKMNGTREGAERLLSHIREAADPAPCAVVVCPPFPLLTSCVTAATGGSVMIGGQDVSAERDGAYTGEVSAGMLRDAGCTHVLVGHSERRVRHREDDDTIARKTRRAIEAGLVPIVCVGETLGERNADATATVLRRQVGTVLDGLDASGRGALVIAYEPVWAIGTGASATPAMVQEAHAVIRRSLARACPGSEDDVCILYGGSVKPGTVEGLVAMPDVDGCLVGGASLDPGAFAAIISAVGAGAHQEAVAAS